MYNTHLRGYIAFYKYCVWYTGHVSLPHSIASFISISLITFIKHFYQHLSLALPLMSRNHTVNDVDGKLMIGDGSLDAYYKYEIEYLHQLAARSHDETFKKEVFIAARKAMDVVVLASDYCGGPTTKLHSFSYLCDRKDDRKVLASIIQYEPFIVFLIEEALSIGFKCDGLEQGGVYLAYDSNYKLYVFANKQRLSILLSDISVFITEDRLQSGSFQTRLDDIIKLVSEFESVDTDTTVKDDISFLGSMHFRYLNALKKVHCAM